MFELIRSILSLAITFLSLYFLLENVAQIQQGDLSGKRIGMVILCALAIFIFPLIFSRGKRKIKKHQKRKIKKKSTKKKSDDASEALMKKIKRKVKLDTNYTPMIIQKCENCGFENPAKTEKCFNCGESLK